MPKKYKGMSYHLFHQVQTISMYSMSVLHLAQIWVCPWMLASCHLLNILLVQFYET